MEKSVKKVLEEKIFKKSICIINGKRARKWFKENKKNLLNMIVLSLFPIILFLAMELLNNMDVAAIKDTKNMVSLSGSIKIFFYNLKSAISLIFIYYFGRKWISILATIAVFLGIYGITGKYKRAMISTTVIGMILAIVNSLLLEIRGTSITPTDFYSICMVSHMMRNIKINFSFKIFVAIGLMVLWIIGCSKIKIKNIDKNKKNFIRVASISLCILFFTIFFKTDLLYVNLTYNTKLFYEKEGIVTGFLVTLKNMKYEKPEGYSIAEITRQFKKGQESAEKKEIEEKSPNIIVIMNESLSDLSDLYNLHITEDNMPFIHSLSENTIKAKVHSSSLGGKTANCEWEFLTGNTTRFLPVGAVPYQLYIKSHVLSIVDTLNAKGYYTTALHPYNLEGYNRNIVYPLIGFKEYKFVDDMENLIFIRYSEYADDLSTYKNIIKLFDGKEEGKRIFNFTVTMQNHLSYDDRSFENSVFLDDYEREEYFELNQYLSLVKLSDEAFEYIVKYFESYNEPTIIMMFGDHQPNLVENYPEIFEETSEENKYIVPMVLWANYDIEEADLGDISMNYLANILFDTAGIEKTAYMEFLEELYKKYSVITTNVYKDIEGNYNNYETIPDEFKLYEYIQYNNIFDNEKIDWLY